MKLNKLWIGFVLGLISSAIAFVILVSSYKTLSVGEFISQMKSLGLLAKTLSICVIPSFFIFFVFYWKHYNRAAQGAVGAALLLVTVLVILGT